MAELNNSSSGKWSETDASNTSPSPDGWASGTFPNQVEPIGRSTMGAIKRFWDRLNGITPVSGTANAIILTPSNTSYPTAYVQGEVYQFTSLFANTGATTININGLGAKNIFRKGTSGAVALTGGEIQAGDNVMISYDGAQFQILSNIASAGNAPLNSPAFTGTPTAPTIIAGAPALQLVNLAYSLSGILNNVQVFTASGTYTPTALTTKVLIFCQGAGGGGAGSGISGAGGGGNGGTTSVGSLASASGGNGGSYTSGNVSLGGTGGTATGGILQLTGSSGQTTTITSGGQVCQCGVSGAPGLFGTGAGLAPTPSSNGNSGSSNTGAGGSSGGGSGSIVTGSGGGAGGLSIAFAANTSTQTVTIGAAGTAGTAGASGYTGGPGGSGVVIIFEYK